MVSIWEQNVEFIYNPPLSENLSVEAVVIGGGLAGLLTAYFLKEKGVECVVLEADRIGSGQTKHTSAKITVQHNLIYAKLIDKMGFDKAYQYAKANTLALETYKTLVHEKNIECEFEIKPAYLYSTLDAEVLKQETEAAKSLGIDAHFSNTCELPFKVEGAVCFENQAQFHPLKFLESIAKELTIYEGTPVTHVEDHSVSTPKATVTAKHIIFATHFPFINRPGYYFIRMHQERSYLLALENTTQLHGMYLGVDPYSLSFRNSGDLLLLGGSKHRTGENSAGDKYKNLREAAQNFWPNSHQVAHWSAQDCMTLDGIPYIGQFSASTPNWYVATGFGKWGMTTSMVAALLISEQIAEEPSPYAEVFSPLRFTPSASAKQLIEEGLQATKGLSREFFKVPKTDLDHLPVGHGGIITVQGEKVGAYKDPSGEIHIVPARCPHLGCQLEWNPDELSWDCPCHGSRFDYTGKLIDNPAQTNLYSEE